MISGKIKHITFEKDKMIIEIDENTKYFSEITKGSVKCEILNELNKIVPLSYLDDGDLIKMKVKDNIIKKIYINSKYQFMSDSSEEGYVTE
jgi:hypothetical protein